MRFHLQRGAHRGCRARIPDYRGAMMARGEYARVIDALPRMAGAEPDYQQKVQAVKDAMATDPDFRMHASWLAQEYAALRDEKEQKEAAVSEVNLRLEAVKQLMADQFEN